MLCSSRTAGAATRVVRTTVSALPGITTTPEADGYVALQSRPRVVAMSEQSAKQSAKMAIDLIRAVMGPPGPPPYSFGDTQPAVHALLAEYKRTYVDYDAMLKGGMQSLVMALLAELSNAADKSPLELLADVEQKWAT